MKKLYNHEIHKLRRIDTSCFTDNHLTIMVPKDMLNEHWRGGDMLIEYVRNESTDLWAVNVHYNGSYHAHNIRNPFWHFNDMFGVLKLVPGFTIDEDCEPFEVVDEAGYHTLAFDTILRITVPRSMITKMCLNKDITYPLHDPLFKQLRLEISYIHPGRDEYIEGTHMIGIADYSNGDMKTLIAERSELLPYDLFNTLNLFTPIAPGFKVRID